MKSSKKLTPVQEYKAAAATISDDLNPAFLYSGVATQLLVDIVSGKINPTELAKRTLENRGLDASGKWVGFKSKIK